MEHDAKIAHRTFSRYSRDAALVLGQLIRRARIEQRMTVAELAERAGVSRGLIHRIEKGDAGCAIGAVFETAAIVGVRLFEADQAGLGRQLAANTASMALLPRSVRTSAAQVKDDCLTSDTAPNPGPGEAYVWIWLPGATAPVVAGRLAPGNGQLVFNYGRSYLARPDAIAIYEPELPLRPGALPLLPGLAMPSAIRDAVPDAWGRRVIITRMLGRTGGDIDTADLSELAYLLESGSDRIGALDFQQSSAEYVPRMPRAAALDELLNAAARVEDGLPLTPALDQALFHGTSIGGARPKAMIIDGDTPCIAKFSAQGDVYRVVKAEFVAMRLAARAGIDAAPVRLARAAGKDVLLVARFDRDSADGGWRRRAMVSALTLLGLDEMMARYASYEDLATVVRHRFHDPRKTLRELFARLVFNVLCGNTDDHARNHAAFWDGRALQLTPAYDVCPQPRTGREASQAMLIVGDERLSRIATCLRAAPIFQMSEADAIALVARQITVIVDHWDAVCNEAGLSPIDRRFLWRRQFLSPFAFDDAPAELKALAA